MNKPKVVFVHHDALVTGSAISLMNMVKGLEPYVQPHVVLAEDGALAERLKEQQIPYSVCSFFRYWTAPGPRIHYPAARNNFKALKPNPELRAHLMALKPDLVHINDKAAMQAGVSLMGSGIPVIQHLRSSFFSTYFRPFKWLFVRKANQYADAFIAISEDETDGFENNPKLNIIYNSLDLKKCEEAHLKRAATRSALGFKDDDILVGFVSHISKQKGAFDFLEAGKQLIQQHPKVQLVMAGKIAEDSVPKWYHKLLYSKDSYAPNQRLNTYKKELGTHLHMLGFRSDPWDVIAALDVLVVCTRLGVLGRQPFEGMAVRTSVVITPGHTGKSNIILHEKTGLIAQARNPASIAQNISRLLTQPELKQQLLLQATAHSAQLFDREKNALNIFALYKQLMGRIKPNE